MSPNRAEGWNRNPW